MRRTGSSDVQFVKENESLVAMVAGHVRAVFEFFTVKTPARPNDVLRAMRIAVKKLAGGEEK